jgi:hypothetical protein
MVLINCLFNRKFRENSVEECGLELYFSVDFEILGQIQSHELVPNGGDKRIDDSNKDEYLRLMTDWRFSRGKDSIKYSNDC